MSSLLFLTKVQGGALKLAPLPQKFPPSKIIQNDISRVKIFGGGVPIIVPHPVCPSDCILYEKRHLTCLGTKVWVLDCLELQFDVRSTGLKSSSKNPQMVAPVGVACKTIPSVNIFGRVKAQHELNKSNKIIPRVIKAIILKQLNKDN